MFATRVRPLKQGGHCAIESLGMDHPSLGAIGHETAGDYTPVMLLILGQHGRSCDGLSWRELMAVSELSLFGLALPGCFSFRLLAATNELLARAGRGDGFGGANSQVLV